MYKREKDVTTLAAPFYYEKRDIRLWRVIKKKYSTNARSTNLVSFIMTFLRIVKLFLKYTLILKSSKDPNSNFSIWKRGAISSLRKGVRKGFVSCPPAFIRRVVVYQSVTLKKTIPAARIFQLSQAQ